MEICSQLTGSHRWVGAYAAITFSPAVAKRSVEQQRILSDRLAVYRALAAD
jgi:hypothetical protein